MQRTRVKFCGMTRPEDAALAGELGADAIGMVFYPAARRCISMERARQILAAIPAFVTPVGLFVNQDTRLILDTAEELRLRTVQLHGHESPDDVAALRGLSVLKAVRADPETIESDLNTWRTARLANLKAILLETPTSAPGGTGIENDWDLIARLQTTNAFEGLPPIIVAGGLTPENVSHVVRRIRPCAVDVSSGIESAFGQKSPEKMKAFLAAVNV
jgi:phosphoribosylanthranilate isomerase